MYVLYNTGILNKSLFKCLIYCIQVNDEECPELGLAIQNHFAAIQMRLGKSRRLSKHRQSLVTLSRRSVILILLYK